MHFQFDVKLRNVVRTKGTTRTESIGAQVHCTALLHLQRLQLKNGSAFVCHQSIHSRPIDKNVLPPCTTCGPKSGTKIGATFGYGFGRHGNAWQHE